MYSMLFLGVGGLRGLTLENTMHHLLSSYYPNGYRFLKFDEIMANPLNRNRGETPTIHSREVNWP